MPRLPLRAVDRGPNLRERFCADVGCDVGQFEDEIFRRCLRRTARVLAWLLGGKTHPVFGPDLTLIARVGLARSLQDVRTVLDDHWCDPANDRWMRRKLGARISTQRLRRIAGHYVPGEGQGPAGLGPRRAP